MGPYGFSPVYIRHSQKWVRLTDLGVTECLRRVCDQVIKNSVSIIRHTQAWIPRPPPASYVNWGKWCNISASPFPHVENKDSISTYLTELLKRLVEMIEDKHLAQHLAHSLCSTSISYY